MAPSIYNNNAKVLNVDNISIHHMDILIKDRTALKREKYKNMLIDIIENNSNNISKDMLNLYKCFLGLEYVYLKEYDVAEKLYLEAYNNEFLYKGFALQCLCQMYLYNNEFDKVKKYLSDENFDVLKNSNVIGNYYYSIDKIKCIKFYEEAILENSLKASNYINLAFLLKDIDKNKARELFAKAIEINPYLNNFDIYGIGYQPNLFEVQSSMLNAISDLSVLIKELGL